MGAAASTPRTRQTPHDHGPKTKTLEESLCNTVKPALDTRADQFQMGGRLHGAGRRNPLKHWRRGRAGRNGQKNCLSGEVQTKVQARLN